MIAQVREETLREECKLLQDAAASTASATAAIHIARAVDAHKKHIALLGDRSRRI